MPNQLAARQAGLTADWLTGGRLLDQLSTAFTLLSLGLALWQQSALPAHAGLLLATIMGGLEKYYAIRVNFDRRVFANWAEQWSNSDSSPPEETMAEFDQTLVQIGLHSRIVEQHRTLEERIAGSRNLLRKQIACLGLQYVCLLGAVLARFALL